MLFNQITKNFFIFILAVVTWAFFNILSPYFSAILWAAILTVLFYPIKNKLRAALGGHDDCASFITIAIICLIVFIPLTIILSSLAIELNIIYNKLQHHNTCFPEILNWLLLHLPNWIKNLFLEHNLNNSFQIQQKLSEITLKSGQYLAGSAFLVGRGTFGFAINFIIMLYLLFFLLKNGPYLIRQILNSLPLSNFVKQHLLAEFVAVTKATVKGTVVVATIQGTLSGIAFYIVHIDGSIIWGPLMGFLSLLPVIGLAIVWIPAAVYLFMIHKIWQGGFIVIFFVLIVGLVDNFLRPLLVGKDTKMPDYLILITTLGGMKIYGINGFVIGPLIAALFIACWNLFSGKDYANDTDFLNKVFTE